MQTPKLCLGSHGTQSYMVAEYILLYGYVKQGAHVLGIYDKRTGPISPTCSLANAVSCHPPVMIQHPCGSNR